MTKMGSNSNLEMRKKVAREQEKKTVRKKRMKEMIIK